jgi:hypothetical protein
MNIVINRSSSQVGRKLKTTVVDAGKIVGQREVSAPGFLDRRR